MIIAPLHGREAPMTFDVSDPEFEARIRTSFTRQGLNGTMGATLGHVAAGRVEIEVPFSRRVSQQHGFFHGGVMGAIGDSACGYAAMTLTPAGAEVLTIEYKVNFLSPGQGDRLIARGRVTKPGRGWCYTQPDMGHVRLAVVIITVI